MKKKLVVFGDSWTRGADLKPGDKTYGELIAERKGMEFQNYSVVSTAVEHMILQLQEMINTSTFANTEYTALFSFTALSRFMYFSEYAKFDKKYKTNCGYVAWNGTEQGDIASEMYYKHIHSTTLDNFKFYTTVIVLQKLCREYNIKDYYALSFSSVDWDNNEFIGVDRQKFWNTGHTNFLDMFGCNFVDPANKYFEGTVSGHPNQQGHELIAQHLSEWIQ
jgi:hypothetical protein